MQILALIAALFGAQPSADACLGVYRAAATGCQAQVQTVIDNDLAVFLSGGDSLLGRVFARLDKEGRLDEVLAQIERARPIWRKGGNTPIAPGHVPGQASK